MSDTERNWQVGDRVAWRYRAGPHQRGRHRRAVGKVVALDIVSNTTGVQVMFDEPLEGYDGLAECYATHAELEPEA